ncbi:unnamed protein product [Pleuronectes platessa]|uniref:Uncharacterized protein n=1 Tax=Pleuronectes platessa TaxID=8262 RepID=A0A9N7V4G2_PLEPL|nr:unnamed protein product [Pleuronectes platessa]
MRDHSDEWGEGDHTAAGDDIPAKRRTMLHHRKRNLVILAHEKSITYKLDMDEFVREFAKGNRRLTLT